MPEVREITNYALWDDFVGKSPQGTIFSTTKWMGLFPYESRIYGYFKGDSLLGGIIGKHLTSLFWSGGFDLTPFQGILVQPIDSNKESTILSLHHEAANALSGYLKKNYDSAKIYNHYTFPDIRPFIWLGWGVLPVKYTYVVDLRSVFHPNFVNHYEKTTRYEASHADIIGSDWGNMDRFVKLYSAMWERKGISQPVNNDFLQGLEGAIPNRVFLAVNRENKYCAGAVSIWDNKRAYYILAASDGTFGASAKLMERVFIDTHSSGVGCPNVGEIDLVGANDKPIAQFKRGFGGKLMPYYGVNI